MTLLLILLCLIFASLAAGFLRYTLDPSEGYLQRFFELFDVGKDSNIPTWYSSVTLLMCSVLLAIVAVFKRSDGDPYTLRWGALSVILLLMSVDELAQMHEIMGSMLKAASIEYAGLHPSGLVFFVWVIPGAIFALVIALAYIKFLLHLPAKIRILFLLAGSMYVTGALLLEMVSARQESMYWGENMPGPVTIFVNLVTTFEELLEMMGVVVLVYALLLYIASLVKNIDLQMYDDTEEPH